MSAKQPKREKRFLVVVNGKSHLLTIHEIKDRLKWLDNLASEFRKKENDLLNQLGQCLRDKDRLILRTTLEDAKSLKMKNLHLQEAVQSLKSLLKYHHIRIPDVL